MRLNERTLFLVYFPPSFVRVSILVKPNRDEAWQTEESEHVQGGRRKRKRGEREEKARKIERSVDTRGDRLETILRPITAVIVRTRVTGKQ